MTILEQFQVDTYKKVERSNNKMVAPQIWATFSKSLDIHHPENKNITHLICSSIILDNHFHYDNLAHMPNGSNIVIVVLSIFTENSITRYDNGAVLIKIDIQDIYKKEFFNDESNHEFIDVINSLYKTDDLIIKCNNNDIKLSSKNTIFMFEYLDMHNILLYLLLNNFVVSGGSTSKRHIISSVEIQLTKILSKLEDSKVIYKINSKNIHDSYLNKKISKTIDINEYKMYRENLENLYKINIGYQSTIDLNYYSNIKIEEATLIENKEINTSILKFIFNNNTKILLVYYNLIKLLYLLKEEIIRIIKIEENAIEKIKGYNSSQLQKTREQLVIVTNLLDKLEKNDISYFSLTELSDYAIRLRKAKDLLILDGKFHKLHDFALKKNNQKKYNIYKNKKNNNSIPNNKRSYSNIASEGTQRNNILFTGGPFHEELKLIIDSSKDRDSLKLTQKLIEERCLKFEYDYINYLLKNNNIKDKYSQFNNKIFIEYTDKMEKILSDYTQPYIINDCAKLIIEVDKKSHVADIVLTILSFNYTYDKNNNLNKTHLINTMVCIILQLISLNDNSGWSGMKENELTIKLGKSLIKRLNNNIEYLNNYIQNKENLYKVINYYNNHVLDLSEDRIGTIGNSLFDLMYENLSIFDRQFTYDSKLKKKYNYISIKDEYREGLIDNSLNTINLPMVAQPKLWCVKNSELLNSNNNIVDTNNLVAGGYYNDKINNIIYNKSFVNKNARISINSDITNIQINTINYLNNQKYKINKDILYFLLEEFNKKDSIIFKDYNRLHPESKNIKDIEDKNTKKKILSHNSLYYLYRNILNIALIYENTSFYLPNFMDFRGRIYCNVNYLSFQGNSIARSLLEFDRGCPLEIIQLNELKYTKDLNNNPLGYVLQYLANTAGKSKCSISNKIKWSIKFLNSINTKELALNFNSVSDSLEIKNIIKGNDEAAVFLSVLNNLVKCINNEKYTFNTPICFDATCSGMQHLSALFGDVDLAKMSNVIGNEEELPKDVYTEVANIVKDRISKLTDANLKKVLSKIIVNRKLLKRPVMTVPYNVSLNSMLEQLVAEGFFELYFETLSKHNKKVAYYHVNKNIVEGNEKLILTAEEMGKFSYILYNAIYIKIPNLLNLISYLNKLISIITKIDKSFFWVTPTGMKIYISYHTTISKENKSIILKKRGNSITLPSTKLDRKTNIVAFIPNLIHSLDSSNIQLLIENIINSEEGHLNLFTIHDCFATSPNTMVTVNKFVKKAFIEIYFDIPYLEKMHNSFIDQIKSYYDVNSEIIKDGDILTEKEYIIINKNEKIILPDKPKFMNIDEVKKVFIEGLTKSLYFIN